MTLGDTTIISETQEDCFDRIIYDLSNGNTIVTLFFTMHELIDLDDNRSIFSTVMLRKDYIKYLYFPPVSISCSSNYIESVHAPRPDF